MMDWIAIVIVGLVVLFFGGWRLLETFDDAADLVNQNSLLGEAPMERRAREKRRRWYRVAFAITCLIALAGWWIRGH